MSVGLKNSLNFNLDFASMAEGRKKHLWKHLLAQGEKMKMFATLNNRENPLIDGNQLELCDDAFVLMHVWVKINKLVAFYCVRWMVKRAKELNFG